MFLPAICAVPFLWVCQVCQELSLELLQSCHSQKNNHLLPQESGSQSVPWDATTKAQAQEKRTRTQEVCKTSNLEVLAV